MSRRYEILDILSQDGTGVSFRAEDRETGSEVVLRRFFPFGPNGGGLDDEERAAYDIAVRRLVSISHPALRNVLDGGTDPHDGMPFVVTECAGGEPLSQHLAGRLLSPPSAKALLDLALETCQVLSEAFHEECVWIETSTDSILLQPGAEERQVTFRICPLRWFGGDENQRSLRSILRLAEEITGWNRRMLSDDAGDGLGAWIKALRSDPDQWSLEAARYALHHGTAALDRPSQAQARPSTPISPAHATIPAQTTPPRGHPRSTPTWWPWMAAAILPVAVLGFVFWPVNRQAEAPPPPSGSSSADPGPGGERGLSAAERVSLRAAELAREIEAVAEIPEPGTAGFASPELNQQLIKIGRQLRGRTGEATRITARLYAVRASNSGKTLYLEFGTSDDPDAICARYRTSKAVFTEEQLRQHIGKLVRVRGKVVNDPGGRIAIDLADEGAVEVMDD